MLILKISREYWRRGSEQSVYLRKDLRLCLKKGSEVRGNKWCRNVMVAVANWSVPQASGEKITVQQLHNRNLSGCSRQGTQPLTRTFTHIREELWVITGIYVCNFFIVLMVFDGAEVKSKETCGKIIHRDENRINFSVTKVVRQTARISLLQL